MKIIYYFLLVALLSSCTQKEKADLIVFNAKVYTVDEKFTIKQAFAVKNGKVLQTGTSDEILKRFDALEKLDAEGKAIYPGFIDGHAHFFAYGSSLQQVDLTGTKSWKEILARLTKFASNHQEGWLIGRGWDQNDWEDKNFPDQKELNNLFPNRPVFLARIDGHAAMVNSTAIELAGLTPGYKLEGGEIETKNGALTGILIDNAVRLVASKMPSLTPKLVEKALLDAQRNCFAVGLTSVTDCGLDHQAVSFIDSLQKVQKLQMRMNVMLSDRPENYKYLFKTGPIKTERLNVSSFKVYADGALGSRGACLLAPYADQAGHSGFLLSNKKHFAEVAQLIYTKGFQMCTHAIGDSANREILHVYAKVLKGKNDRRWRIEHAQIISDKDFNLFGEYSIIPSVQPTHATSDMYWAKDRLGADRLKGAYAYKQLLQQNGWLVLGTDFPVEQINPLLTFHAAVTRQDAKNYPAKGFQSENALTRQQTLRGMTIWAAKGNFEEMKKGSLEKGKLADFVILDQDIMTSKPEHILQAKVFHTYLNGKKVF
jgi:predicted amidohydrolase YtcJ